MSKPTTLRLLLTLLLLIQSLCWSLTLLHLLHPSKLRTLQANTANLLAHHAAAVRTATRMLAPLVSHRATALLSYTQIYEMWDGLVA
ncbi:predicted protein [Plenodomus lingam JN3]|uniref:Predicted protein n=1 Tax=Leptosphaeria maculans (strain JN3 / isolate v23.1.3 / race Av1-4-5-6-7-8) TaxID=985895 RepID=E5A925_LEPMJ|nr:predicted protein [Plenodomus lingam JN3]CBY00120.1 predicted protein [Plenodomus lingam JN3]